MLFSIYTFIWILHTTEFGVNYNNFSTTYIVADAATVNNNYYIYLCCIKI